MADLTGFPGELCVYTVSGQHKDRLNMQYMSFTVLCVLSRLIWSERVCSFNPTLFNGHSICSISWKFMAWLTGPCSVCRLFSTEDQSRGRSLGWRAPTHAVTRALSTVRSEMVLWLDPDKHIRLGGHADLWSCSLWPMFRTKRLLDVVSVWPGLF